ncbi:MAG: EamA family transporter [Stappia sp.]|uniref:DMT family transporter n=1 Tax=Stappia sp. TaxID=1870903 RepID=UPI000C4DEE4C|nr:DMT family transporter [Stappia sp.]MAA98893.1 EamA family transporter [Stappia sp.]MBM21562.1 EamA family transporter [Stappia sp.]
MIADRPLLGMIFMLGFCLLAPLGDSIAKILGESLPLALMVLARFMAQVAILIPLAWATRLKLAMTPRILRLTVLRTLLHIIGIGAMFLSLRFLPLADAISIAFVMPFMMLLLGRFVLGEQVGPYRLGACIVGFVGVLLVIRPNYAEVGTPALLPLAVAAAFSLFMMVTRNVAKDVDPIALQAVSGVVAVVLMAPAIWGASLLGFESGLRGALETLATQPRTLALLLGIGTLGTLAHLMMTWSLRLAPASTLAPMQYLEIPFATLIGWVIFADLPDGLAAVGISLTVGAGLYVIHREQVTARRAAAAETA